MKIRKQKGFTLVELLVVIAIIAILAAVIAPNAFKAIEKSKISAAISDYKAFKTATLSYYADTGTWPEDNANKDNDKGFIIKPSGVTGWNGPYLEKWPAKNPWGGEYKFNSDDIVDWSGDSDEARYIELDNVPESAYDKLRADLGNDVVKPDIYDSDDSIYILISID